MPEQTIKARPTVYRGIKMRSRLEADHAQALDSDSFDWVYEPQCFANEHGQYLPDFEIVGRWGKPLGVPRWFIEVKPANIARNGDLEEIDAILKRMSIIWSSEPAATLSLHFWEYGGPVILRIYTVPIDSRIWWACEQGGPGSQKIDGRDGRPLYAYLWRGMGQEAALRKGPYGLDLEEEASPSLEDFPSLESATAKWERARGRSLRTDG